MNSSTTNKYILYFDDTGSRNPDHQIHNDRKDKMDCFGLGGILIKEEDLNDILEEHKEFCNRWSITYPLHSSKIRGGQGKFAWLKKPENAGLFYQDLQDFLLSLPIICIACIIDRGGYNKRYRDNFHNQLWLMCKTAFCILIERASKFSDQQNRKLEIYFEGSGKNEDRDFIKYIRELKSKGNPFDLSTSKQYNPFSAKDFRRIILGEPRRKTKEFPMMQIADLVLYPIAKGGYDKNYRPYKSLKEANKLLDSHLEEKDIPFLGIKYSCFEHVDKIKGSD